MTDPRDPEQDPDVKNDPVPVHPDDPPITPDEAEDDAPHQEDPA